MIPYFRLSTSKEELEALTYVHGTGNWAIGEAINEVEGMLSNLFQQKQVVLTSNGYSALFISLKALGIRNQKIILPCISTCFAISNAIIASNNIPVFCDVNKEDGNCDIKHVSSLVKEQNINYIISPNHAGNISDISYFKNELKMTVIEDACQSFFSSLYINSEADIQVFSFYPTKGVNGIDGGAIITSNKALANKARLLVYYNNQVEFEAVEHYNFRFLNINAQVLLANLKRIEIITKKLKQIKDRYITGLKNKEQVQFLANSISEVPHRFVIYFKTEESKAKAENEFKKNDVSLSHFYEWICPKENRQEYPNASFLVEKSFCVPFFEDLKNDEIETIVKTLDNAFS
ncbi:MAG TPA: DegT/DnrJ/EryC1/StrS aminotransferase family protein [Bacteroidia bacterium]|nr:DegT/DnrJ/EryC1/StrS aminotransferase family protein [Bacteroidia bacterium]